MSELTHQKFLRLLQSLHDATASGRLQWEDTVEEKTFHVALPHGLVRISMEQNVETAAGVIERLYVVTLVDDRGRVVERAEFPSLGENDPRSIGELYELARRSALRSEEVLDRVLADIAASGR